MISHLCPRLCVGGAAQNSIRGAQWMLPAGATSYFGAVGKDSFADTMRQVAKKDGVDVRYMENAEVPTGSCAVLINGKNRSLVANLSAANTFKPSHIDDNWSVVEQAKYFYVSGFFLTVSVDSYLKLAKHAAEHDKVFTINLSAPFLCQFFKEQMLQVLPYADIVFGNESEAAAFAESNGYADTKNIKEIALKLSQHQKVNGKRARIVIITQGADPVIVAKDGQVQEYSIIPIAPEKIVDTNGAGDAFVGGYLSQLVQEKSIETCIKAGNFLANLIIQRSGASYPEEKNIPSF